MATAKKMGATVIRAWAFLNVENCSAGRAAFQYLQDKRLFVREGADGLQGLDALIAAAEELDIKLILPLINYWNDLGGMRS